jgi:toxoflavin biosynthesis protein ToxD
MRDPVLPDLVTIPAGRTLIGTMGQGAAEDQPASVVDVAAFAIGRTPVTCAEFATFVESGGAKPRSTWGGLRPPHGCEDHPVTGCSWCDASAYCRWLSDQTGRTYYLPSEAEWERAARGSMALTYPWGDDFDPDKANTSEARCGGTTSVASHPEGASPWGVLDMAGNAWEWTRDLFTAYPYQPTQEDEVLPLAPGISEDRRRVLRGGSWMAGAHFARCSFRAAWYPSAIFSGQVGFRLACRLIETENNQ